MRVTRCYSAALALAVALAVAVAAAVVVAALTTIYAVVTLNVVWKYIVLSCSEESGRKRHVEVAAPTAAVAAHARRCCW